MKRIIYATKGWKKLQASYIQAQLHMIHTHKLQALLPLDVSGFGFRQAASHYTLVSHAAACAAVAGYMEAGTWENAESYFCLSTLAKRTARGILEHDPTWEFERVSKLQMLDNITAAVLCGLTPAALDLLASDRLALGREKVPMWNGQPDTRIDKKQEARRKQRRALEIGLFENLLRQEDEPARAALEELDGLQYDPLNSQVIHALLDQDGPEFADAVVLHMREFRSGPDAQELNDFVLLMEALYLKRGPCQLPDLADAPAALLALPECGPSRLEEVIGGPIPVFDIEAVLPKIDPNRRDWKIQQY